MTSLVANMSKTSTTTVTASTNERKNATLWINIGVILPGYQDKNGNPVRMTLPIGVPLDTMKDGVVKESAPEYIKAAIIGGNALKEQLLKLGEKMENGECKDITKLGLRLFLQKTKQDNTDNGEKNSAELKKEAEDRLSAMFSSID